MATWRKWSCCAVGSPRCSRSRRCAPPSSRSAPNSRRLERIIGARLAATRSTIQDARAHRRPSPPAPPDLQARARLADRIFARSSCAQARSQAEIRLQLALGQIDFTVGGEYRRQDGSPAAATRWALLQHAAAALRPESGKHRAGTRQEETRRPTCGCSNSNRRSRGMSTSPPPSTRPRRDAQDRRDRHADAGARRADHHRLCLSAWRSHAHRVSRCAARVQRHDAGLERGARGVRAQRLSRRAAVGEDSTP